MASRGPSLDALLNEYEYEQEGVDDRTMAPSQSEAIPQAEVVTDAPVNAPALTPAHASLARRFLNNSLRRGSAKNGGVSFDPLATGGEGPARGGPRRRRDRRCSTNSTNIQFLSRQMSERSVESHKDTRLAYNTRSWGATCGMWGHLVRGRFFVLPWALLTLFSLVCALPLPWHLWLPAALLKDFDDFAIPTEVPIALGATMSLLLAFRLNVSYARWWEARELWGDVISGSRSLLTILIAAAQASDAAGRATDPTSASGDCGGASERESAGRPSGSGWNATLAALEAERARQRLLRQVAGWNVGVAVALFHHLRGDPPEMFATFPGLPEELMAEELTAPLSAEDDDAADAAAEPAAPGLAPGARGRLASSFSGGAAGPSSSCSSSSRGGSGDGSPSATRGRGSPALPRAFARLRSSSDAGMSGGGSSGGGGGGGASPSARPSPKHHDGGAHDGLYTLLSRAQLGAMARSNHPPLYAVGRLREAIEGMLFHHFDVAHSRGYMARLQAQHATLHASLFNVSEAMLRAVSGCERIMQTPCPPGYVGVLRAVMLFWLLLLPLSLVGDLSWGAVPITSIISFLVLAVEEIAVEIENPFGLDPNDLPLHTYCLTVQADALRLLDENRDRDAVRARESQERAGWR